MAINYNPKITTNGLVLCLDAANSKSYPGSGTTWFDLSGNGRNGTLVNGPSFTTTNQGIIVFDGVNDHVTCNAPISSAFSECTVEIVFKTTVAGNSGSAFLLWDHSAGHPIWLGKSQGNEWYWFWNYAGGRGKSAQISSVNYSANSWIHIAVRFYLSNSTRISETNNFAELIVNGNSFSTSHRNDNDLTLSYPSGQIYIARKGTAAGNGELGATVADYSTIDVSLFRVYNRVLSRLEILQNFNALRGRYGI
jgi:hypothetical protein